MEKTYTQEEKNGGYFTLFSCLIFLVLSGLLLACLSGILLYQGKSKSKMAQAGALEHLAANYDKELLERYHLFFLDPRMEAHLEEKTKEYLEEWFLRAGSSTGRNQLLHLRVKEVQIETFATMQEQECRYFTTQIKEFMKYDTTKDALLKVLCGTAEQTENQVDQVDDLKQLLDEKDAAIQEVSDESTEAVLVPSQSVDQTSVANIAQNSNPVKTLKSTMKGGLLAFVTEGSELSDVKISPSNLPSGAKKEKQISWSDKTFSGLSDFQELLDLQEGQKLTDSLTTKGLLAIYTEKYFNYYNKKQPIENTELNYEMEYILGGQLSDQENLEYVVNRLVLLRFCFNAAYAFGDEEMNGKALALAGATVGLTGSGALVEAAKYTILSAVSLLEAVEDVKRLMAGERVSLFKNTENFRWSVSGKTKKNAETAGLTYEKYLMILFLMSGNQQRQMLRMQDVMQINIQRTEPGFLIHNARAGLILRTTVIQNTGFLPGTYEFQAEDQYTY